MVDRGQQRSGGLVAGRTLDRHAPLPDRRDEPRRIELVVDQVGEPEDLERRDGHHDRASVGHLAETGLDVAAQLDEGQVGAHRCQLGPASYRAGGDGGTVGELSQR